MLPSPLMAAGLPVLGGIVLYDYGIAPVARVRDHSQPHFYLELCYNDEKERC